jgi:hypothetical protein
VISTVVPIAPAGSLAVIEVSLATVNELASARPNVTAVAPARNDALMVTEADGERLDVLSVRVLAPRR